MEYAPLIGLKIFQFIPIGHTRCDIVVYECICITTYGTTTIIDVIDFKIRAIFRLRSKKKEAYGTRFCGGHPSH